MAKKTKLSRRSFLGRVAGAVTATGAAGIVTGCATPGGTGYTDRDYGRYADRAGNGRGPNAPRTGTPQQSQPQGGRTDWDPQDRAGQGVGGRVRRAGCTDADTGTFADGPGSGTRCG